jgi:hypothetical protein
MGPDLGPSQLTVEAVGSFLERRTGSPLDTSIPGVATSPLADRRELGNIAGKAGACRSASAAALPCRSVRKLASDLARSLSPIDPAAGRARLLGDLNHGQVIEGVTIEAPPFS